MKKSSIALSLCGLFAATVHAQSNVTIYGLIDEGLNYSSDGRNHIARLQSGELSASRIGFTGTEDLGAGLAALFSIENGFNADTGALSQSDTLFNRLAVVGLKGGDGTLTLGLQYEPLHTLYTKFTTHQIGFGDGVTAFVTSIEDIRLANSIKYVSPTFNGVTLTGMYALGENTTVPTAADPSHAFGNLYNVQANYDSGPFATALSYVSKRKTVATPNNVTEFLAAAAYYDFGVVKPYVTYETVRNSINTPATVDLNVWSLAADVPLGGGRLNGSYGRLTNKTVSNANAQSFSLVYDYDYSKRTTFYVGATKVRNGAAAGFSILSASGLDTAVAASGLSPNAMVLGMRHKF